MREPPLRRRRARRGARSRSQAPRRRSSRPGEGLLGGERVHLQPARQRPAHGRLPPRAADTGAHGRRGRRATRRCARISPERVRCERSSIDSAAARTAATSRLPHASVSEKIGVSARPAASCFDRAQRDLLAAGPRGELVHLARELVEVVADELDQRAARLGRPPSRRAARTARRPTPAGAASARRREDARPPSRPPSRARSRPSSRRRRARARSPAQAPRDTRRPPSRRRPSSARPRRRRRAAPRRRTGPSALQAATASSPLASRALRCSVESSPMRSRSRRSARAIFGRSLPDEEIRRLQVARHAAKHKRRPRGRPRRARRPPPETSPAPPEAPPKSRRAGGEKRRAPAVDCASATASGGATGATSRRDEREGEHLGDDGHADDVRGDRHDRHLVELDPRDRRRREPARGRDGDELREGTRHRVALEDADDARGDDEDRRRRRRTRAGSRRRARMYGFHAAARPRPRASACHAVALAARSATRARRARRRSPARMTDGCGPTASTYAPIAASATSSAAIRPRPSRPHEREHRACNRRHLQSVDREHVVEPGGAEALPRACRPSLASRRARPPSSTARRSPSSPAAESAREPALQIVGDTAEPATAADDAPRPRAHHHVDPLAPQPGGLVEPVRRSPRQVQDPDEREPRALRRRRTPGRELEEHALARPHGPPPQHGREHAGRERPDASRLVGLDHRILGGADARKQHAAIERVQPAASPPPARNRERARLRARTRAPPPRAAARSAPRSQPRAPRRARARGA